MLARRLLCPAATLAVLTMFLAAAASASTSVSYRRFAANNPDLESVGGGAVTASPSDLVDLGALALVFDEIPEVQVEDIDAAHVDADGAILFSPVTVIPSFKGLANVQNGDIVRYDPNTDTASIVFFQSTFTAGTITNVDAVSRLPNGNLLISTASSPIPASADGLPGLPSFLDGDVVEWDGASASVFLGEGTIFTSGSNANLNALHALSETEIVFSTFSNGVGKIGSNYSFVVADETSSDLLTYDSSTNLGGLYLDGDGLFDGNTRILDAVFIPEPGTGLLLGLGLIGALLRRSR